MQTLRRNLKILNRLKPRRLVFYVAFVYKIINSVIKCPELLQKFGFKVPTFNFIHNPPFLLMLYAYISVKNKLLFINIPICCLSMMCNQINVFDYFQFSYCVTALKTCIFFILIIINIYSTFTL